MNDPVAQFPTSGMMQSIHTHRMERSLKKALKDRSAARGDKPLSPILAAMLENARRDQEVLSNEIRHSEALMRANHGASIMPNVISLKPQSEGQDGQS